MVWFIAYMGPALLFAGGLCQLVVRKWRNLGPARRIMILAIAVIPLLPYARVELLTVVHGGNAEAYLDAMDEVVSLRDMRYFRVFEWSPDEVRILVVLREPGESVWDGGVGLMLVVRRGRLRDRWIEAVWSSSGSADSTTWPPYP